MAETLHGTDPAFIPPFPGSVAKYLSPKSAFHLRHGEITGFVASRNGRPVGRIAAIINRSHNERYSDKTGFFGFFECENDPATAGALFRQVAEVLQVAGMDRIRGPYNPSINDECGMLADRFDMPPCIGMPWNPEYYLTLVAGEKFVSARVLHIMNLPLHRLPQPARLARIVDRMAS
ncbi:MAG: N-acetyltransferase, partial [Verrucomicrobiota bacterium]